MPARTFVMTFAVSEAFRPAGILFAMTVMFGVALTLSCVVLLSIRFRERLVDHRRIAGLI
ncbi:hypothetical protein NKI61_08310 [Mesorhizobium sp. M0514]|uniref:hypothetical protein n=1 Tax=Mesorhizobium sp. M0514 TaxID=2956955 RepID=UPI00333A3107